MGEAPTRGKATHAHTSPYSTWFQENKHRTRGGREDGIKGNVTNHSHRNGTNRAIGTGTRSAHGSCSHVQAVRYTFYNMEGCAGYSLASEGWQVVDPPSD